MRLSSLGITRAREEAKNQPLVGRANSQLVAVLLPVRVIVSSGSKAGDHQESTERGFLGYQNGARVH